MKKKLAVMALAAATLSMMAMPVYADDLVTVGYAQVGHESDWRTANTQNYQDVFSEDAGYSLDLVDCDNDNAAQLEAVRTFISKDMDYIVIAPIQSAGWDTVLQEAQDAGIPVIIADREIEASDDLYDAWVGTNTTNEGITAGNWLAEYLGDKDANILVIEGSVGASAALGRTEGFNQVAGEHDNWKILDSQSGDFTQAGGQEVMESFLKKYKKDMDVVYCENDNEAFGAIDAIENAGYKVGADGDMLVFSFDSTKAGLQDVKDGKITLDTECNPLHGPRVEKIIEQLEKGETPDKQAYVDEEMFAHDDTVTSVKVDGQDYPVTVVTDEVLKGRKY